MRLVIYDADLTTVRPIPYADGGIRAGFPSPAQDYMTDSIDLNRELVEHPASTFYARVVGDSMEEEGITDGDILVVDKSIEPEHGDLTVCCVDGEFTLKRLCIKTDGRILLMPSNRRYRPIVITEDTSFTVWGVVTFTIKANRRRRRGSERW
ncbi:MAG: translesion error-prone DNA polymerase V autoproteolytic subunit [Lachnoclostridium sp.]|nr:translesion error-prone DNA polymerase V autoproteolytic subunit [Lachnoclostridium sp.]